MKIPFWKVEAIGNDFPLVHEEDILNLSQPDLARAMAERRFGVGGDGLLVLGQREGDLMLRMYNPDGTEDFCGNGLRSAAFHAHKHGWVGERFRIHHHGRDVSVVLDGEAIRTDIGRATYQPLAIPADMTEDEMFGGAAFGDVRHASVLSTGSTHVVIHGPLPTDAYFVHKSPEIETDARFPERTSVIWCEQTRERTLRIRIWERGVGETLGCGTGSSAAATDFMRRHGIAGPITVHNPGGTVVIDAESWDAPLVISGTAEEVYQGVYLFGHKL